MSVWRQSDGTLPGEVEGRHLDRRAVIHARRSTLQQLVRNRGSTAVQHALVERACLLGWARPRVTIVDEDLGCSGGSAAGRPALQRLVAAVGLGQVGLILGFEVSRLARSCRDWCQLLEVCALSGTLIGGTDGLHDPGLHDDRLLLGLKGTMSGAELRIMRARLEEGRWRRAERGELGCHPPRGGRRAARRARWRRLPTSGRAMRCIWCSRSSTGAAASMASCAICAPTAWGFPIGCGAGRPRAIWSGDPPAAARC